MPIISPDLPSDGETADAADVNDVFNAILAVINGGIDADNMAANSVGTSELVDGSVTEVKLAAATRAGWYTGMTTPTTVTANGNRSYTLVFNTVDYTGIINPGTRLRLTRSVAAPTQCTSLNGTTQYWVKTSPNKMTFTDDFVTAGWIKLTSYPGTAGMIVSRYNGTSGWVFYIAATGQVLLQGYNAGAANTSYVISYQALPLNKWIHVSAQLDMSAFTATTTTSYVMIDGMNVPASVVRGGTNPTALVQAGNLEVGSTNGGTLFFPGKLAQVAVFSAKVTQATMQTYISQGLAGNESNLASAYSFNNSTADLNTTTPNDLSAGAGAPVATNADTPFGIQASGLASSTLVYAIAQSVTFSTNTTVVVQVPEGNTIPTSGGITAVAYSGIKAPYAMPVEKDKWRINMLWATQSATVSNATFAAHPGMQLIVPIGAWDVGYQMGFYTSDVVAYTYTVSDVSQTGLANTASDRSLQTRTQGAAAAVACTYTYVVKSVSHTSAATYIMYTLGASTNAGFLGTTTLCEMFAENTYL